MGKATERGKRGEKQAAAFLREHGYYIIEENYRWQGGEIDLVAREGNYLVFVEVKSRSSEAFGTPEEAITVAKRRRLIRTAQKYLLEHPTELEVRFDVVTLFRGKAKLYRDAFSLEG